MDTLEKLYQYCADRGIVIENHSIHSSLSGLFLKIDDCPPVIILNPELESDRDKLIEVLAEEIGHYETTSGNFTRKLSRYSDKIELTKVEEKAVRWACDFLVSDEDVLDYLSQSIEPYEICQMLDIPSFILDKKIYFMKLKNKL